MKGLAIFLSLFFVIPAYAQNLTRVQTECTHVRNDSTRPEHSHLNETKLGKDMVCRSTANSTPTPLLLKPDDLPADHSVVPKIDSPPPPPVKTAFIKPAG